MLVVLLLVAITLGLSYAAVRSQYTGLQIQRNSDRQGAAHRAAVTGLTMAIKKMHTDDWGGVETTLTGSLGSDENYEVTYTAGDASLLPGHVDYNDLPYRVTLLSTGYAADPDNPQCVAMHRVRAVVRLVPRELGDEPTDWGEMQQYTVYQTEDDSFELDIPCRLEGPVRVQDKLRIAVHYPKDNAWWRYLGDLNAMRLAGHGDFRPLTGPVDLALSLQTKADRSALTGKLAVTANDTPLDRVASDWTKPTGLTVYRIYDGGPVYTIPSIGTTLDSVTLEPDPLTNPLGIYYRNGSLTIRDDVTIRGSLFCQDKVTIDGVNVAFQSVDLPALHGSTNRVRLPVVSCEDFTVTRAAGGRLAGLLAVFDMFEVRKGPETTEFAVTGRVVTRELRIKEREPWETLDWSKHYDAFEDQLDEDEGPVVPYFPMWMGTQGRDPVPRLTINADSDPITYHWKYADDPVYVSHAADDGLRWELREWTDVP